MVTGRGRSFWSSLNIFSSFWRKPLWAHLFWAVVFVVSLLYASSWAICFFTYHDSYERVPGLIGKTYHEADRILKQNELTAVVSDSLFLPQYPPFTVIKQIPEKGAVVKTHRNVYLILNKMEPPLIDLPKIIGLDVEVAQSILKSAGLAVADTLYGNDQARNIVIGLRFNGQDLEEDKDKVPLASKLTVILGNGGGGAYLASGQDNKVWTPDLIGKTLVEAQAVVAQNHLRLFVDNASEFAHLPPTKIFVTRQIPFRYDEDNQVKQIDAQSVIHVWVGDKNALQ